MRAVLTIDLDAIVANWRALDALSAPGVRTAAVLKADAYGLGAARVGPALARAGVDTFFVALAEEGTALRGAIGPGPEIFVLSGLMEGDAAHCNAARLCPLLNSPEQARRLRDAGLRDFGVQIDSGMHRLGFAPGDLPADWPGTPRLVVSHMACADTPGHPQNAAQRAAFVALTARLEAGTGTRPNPVPRSLAATAGTLLGAAFHFDMTRPGIGLFGGAEFAGARPVVALSLPVIQTRTVDAGAPVGYGAAWRADRPSRIATVSGGYADGIIRAMGNRARLYAGSAPCPVVGRVSMDLLTVDVTDLAHVPPTLDLLCDRQGIDAVAQAAGTIGYEILTSLGARYERVYKGG